MDNPRRDFHMKHLKLVAFASILLLCVPVMHTQEAPITSFQRAYIGIMLNEVKDDVKHYYYDP
jgi:hypothetical protein